MSEPIECVWLDEWPTTHWGEAGQMWFADEHYPRSILSEHYKVNVASVRPPIMVTLPGRRGNHVNWCIDSHPSADPAGHWDVEVDLASLVAGQRPNITVAPSINCKQMYHGFLQAGVLTADIGE